MTVERPLTGPAPGPHLRRRGDIQGLRAVAVLLVLAFHAGWAVIPGGYVGVDVFFVISGFLITGLLVKEAEQTGRVSLGRFYGRRARRLLPAAGAVLVFVALITVVVLPVTRWRPISMDMLASAMYLINWRLADQSVDYLAADQAHSPLQHYWSLAVEEQFYIVWPLIVVMILVVARRVGFSLRKGLWLGLGIVALPSLGWSMYLTSQSPERAYFVTTTRLWELAIGAAVALSTAYWRRLPGHVANGMATLGLVAVVSSAVLMGAETAFPGYAALLPTLGAAAIIAAGIAASNTAISRFLSWTPLQDIGELSYSLYLWHWPVLVAGTALWGRDDGSVWWVTGSVLVLASSVPAWFTYRVIENPIHRSQRLSVRPHRALLVGAASMALPLAAATTILVSPPLSPAAVENTTIAKGAEVLQREDPASEAHASRTGQTELTEASVVAIAAAAVEDNPAPYAAGCHQDLESGELMSCVYGDRRSDKVVALVGDSHALQWQPALAEIAGEHGWRLETYTKSSCGFFSVDVMRSKGRPYGSCSEWNVALMDHLTGPQRPDVVVTTGSNNYVVAVEGQAKSRSESDRLLANGYAASWRQASDAGVSVIALASTPWVGIDVPECLAENPQDIAKCATSREEALQRAGDEQESAANKAPGVQVLDLNPWICPGEKCDPVIGGVVVWRDAHHLTATYARTLAAQLDEMLVAAGVFSAG